MNQSAAAPPKPTPLPVTTWHPQPLLSPSPPAPHLCELQWRPKVEKARRLREKEAEVEEATHQNADEDDGRRRQKESGV
ncbi:hypothetical protein V6N12_046291 [Hibiscus sabdariffa]|uniref:Uncharacterized protein n=1 Tax=Hibiscus sabdariffa TaxID=183260 RepID=A0ABR1Z747_9ROSI